MKRWYMAVAAGLCAAAPVAAQDGRYAPTAPMVPAPTLANGGAVAPAGGWGAAGPGVLTRNAWSPVRSPVVPAPQPTSYSAPLPTGYGGHAAPCGPADCGHARGGLNWDRFKAWLCFHQTKSDLPKLNPAPYVHPLQGAFPCTAAAGSCAPCGPTVAGHPVGPTVGYPAPPGVPTGPQMQSPPQPLAGATMPPRGLTGAPASNWNPRPAMLADPYAGLKYTPTAPAVKPASGTQPR